MGLIKVENIRVFAHHGCLPEERIIGSRYRVDLAVMADLKNASLSDELKDTVDYVALNAVVVREMKKPSKLLETVAGRIIDGVFDACPLIRWVNVSVAKINPPLGGDVEKVVVVLEMSRS
jgi:dihydroneopterin aldolase